MFAILPIFLQAAAPAPLQPNGNWTVAYERTMCLASRKFGPSGEVELLLRPSPLGESLEITFVQAGSTDRRVVLDGDGQLKVGPRGEDREASFKAWRSASQKGRVIIVYTGQSLLDALTDDSFLSFSGPKEAQLTVQTRQFAKLKPVLADCKRKVAQHWGVTSEYLEQLARPAEPNGDAARWVSTVDYPMEAFRTGKSGLVTVLLKIGLAGTVEECRVIETSGVPTLETASCRAFKRHAKYKPAQDRAGQPMESWDIRRVWWITPAVSP